MAFIEEPKTDAAFQKLLVVKEYSLNLNEWHKAQARMARRGGFLTVYFDVREAGDKLLDAMLKAGL